MIRQTTGIFSSSHALFESSAGHELCYKNDLFLFLVHPRAIKRDQVRMPELLEQSNLVQDPLAFTNAVHLDVNLVPSDKLPVLKILSLINCFECSTAQNGAKLHRSEWGVPWANMQQEDVKSWIADLDKVTLWRLFHIVRRYCRGSRSCFRLGCRVRRRNSSSRGGHRQWRANEH